MHQDALAANISRDSYALNAYIRSFAAGARTSVAAAQSTAIASAYNQMVRQATMLAYKNAFALLAFTALVLSPLVWIMRLPSKSAKIDPEQMAAH